MYVLGIDDGGGGDEDWQTGLTKEGQHDYKVWIRVRLTALTQTSTVKEDAAGGPLCELCEGGERAHGRESCEDGCEPGRAVQSIAVVVDCIAHGRLCGRLPDDAVVDCLSVLSACARMRGRGREPVKTHRPS